MNEVTRLLDAIGQGDAQASDELLPLVYDELRSLARRRLAVEKPGQTLQPTALVHEAYLRLVGPGGAPGWNGRGHFFAAAAEAMRRILVENARRNGRIRHGGQLRRVELTEFPAGTDDGTLLALDEALTQLEAEDPVAARVVAMHHFAGLSYDEIARVLDLTVYRVRQKWAYARAWLREALKG